MLLLHPETAFFQERNTVVVSPGEILLLNFVPNRAALLRAHCGLFVDTMLELIDAYQIRNRRQRAGKMRIFCLLHVLLAEEILQVRIGEVLHSHGVNLVDLACGAQVGGQRLAAHGGITRKCVPGFVCEHVDIRRGAVEVGEDIGRFVVRQIGAVTANVLAGAGFQVKQAALR